MERREKTSTGEHSKKSSGETALRLQISVSLVVVERVLNLPPGTNLYINNSPGVFSCIRAGANTGATCICTEMNSLKNLANIRQMIPQKYFPVFA